MKPKEIARRILDNPDALLKEDRVGGMFDFRGILIPCSFDIREDLKQTIIEALELIKKQ